MSVSYQPRYGYQYHVQEHPGKQITYDERYHGPFHSENTCTNRIQISNNAMIISPNVIV